MTQTTTTAGQRYRATLARLAAGALLAGGLLTGAAGLAHADTPPSGASSTAGVAHADTPASGAASAALAKHPTRHRHDSSWQKGHRDGFKEGFKEGLERCKPPLHSYLQNRAKPDSYTRGFEAGYAEGYQNGRAAHCP